VDLAAAFSSAKDEVQKVQTRDFENLGNGWTILSAKFSGDFLNHYAARAFVAAKGYMQLRPTQALYPVYNITETLLSSQTYRVQFFGKPAVDGFWSLTMYDQHGYLVPNELNRFSLNNRDNMTYPNGGLVRDTALDSKAQFYMLLQSTLYSIAPEWESKYEHFLFCQAQSLIHSRFFLHPAGFLRPRLRLSACCRRAITKGL
jgi:hypothetical protein